MIRRTFQHIPGVGPWREKDLWARGVLRWEDFLASSETLLSKDQDVVARERIVRAAQALEQGDLFRLAEGWPRREHWRLYPRFADRAAFFDIETDGDEQNPTVVSVFDRSGLRVFLRGVNLDALPAALAESPLWVTFNGSLYDVPILQRAFSDLPTPELHVDLRFVYQRLGLPGGLKSLEDEMGIARPLRLRGVHGAQAVLLWRAYHETGSLEPLRLLVEYNLYDAFQLRSLLELGYNRAVDDLALDEPHLPVFDRGDVLYDVSRLLLSLEPPAREGADHQRVL